MDREVKVKEGERLMVENLKRGILVGKREGNSTPSPSWKFGLVKPDGTLIHDSNFSSNLATLSARKLGANLWEMEPQLEHRVPKIKKYGPALSNHKFSLELDVAAATNPSKLETSYIGFRKQHAATLVEHNARVEDVGQAQQPLSPASSTSMEMPLLRSAISPSSSFVSHGKFRESGCNLKTSTELLKVLNRIWSLEEKHALDMSLVKSLRRELGQSQAQIQELMLEKKRDQDEIDHLVKKVTGYKIARKEEQQQIKDAVKLVDDKLEDELKLRRHTEKGHHRLAKELSQMKSSFSNVLRELDRERKARILLEDLCDEFAKGIRDYEQEVRFIKHKYCRDEIGKEENDRLILHISEAWLDERAQMKLADACDISKQKSALDKLCPEIEAFLREKQSDTSGKKVDMSSRSPSQSSLHTHSLESFHLKEPSSAPWHGNDGDGSIGITHHRPQLSRNHSLKQGSNSAWQPGETGHNRETRQKPVKEKVHSRRGSDPSCSHSHIQHQNMNEAFGNSNEWNHPRKCEILQRSSLEEKSTDLQDTTRYPSLTSEDTKLGREDHIGPKNWTAEVSSPDICVSSSRCASGIKPHTLKAKLIEARLEGQQSRTRISRGLSKGD